MTFANHEIAVVLSGYPILAFLLLWGNIDVTMLIYFETHTFLLLISDRGMAEAHGLAFNASADALARAFWPGPLTLVLPGGSGQLPDLLRGPDGGIAVRWTSHQAIASLVGALGAPLTSTSANLPGQPPGPGADAIARDFAPAVESGALLVLDGGVLGNRPPSTVVDCTRPRAQIVREGTLSISELRRAVGRLAP